jgi:hypothetical protein
MSCKATIKVNRCHNRVALGKDVCEDCATQIHVAMLNALFISGQRELALELKTLYHRQTRCGTI